MKMNNHKCHLLISGNKNEQMWVKIESETVWESNTIHLLGMAVDYDLTFEKHLPELYKKANRRRNKTVNFMKGS